MSLETELKQEIATLEKRLAALKAAHAVLTGTTITPATKAKTVGKRGKVKAKSAKTPKATDTTDALFTDGTVKERVLACLKANKKTGLIQSAIGKLIGKPTQVAHPLAQLVKAGIAVRDDTTKLYKLA